VLALQQTKFHGPMSIDVLERVLRQGRRKVPRSGAARDRAAAENFSSARSA